MQAGGLLIQNYVNAHGMTHGFAFPAVSMVKKGGGLEDATRIWPSNPWTGKLMGPGTSRGTYTYALRNGGTAYSLTMHLSSGKYVFKGTMPAWLRTERNTASKQNLLLLQRYLDSYKTAHGDYPPTGSLTPETLPSPTYVWPSNPWTGAPMTAGDALGDFSYTRLELLRLRAEGQAEQRVDRLAPAPPAGPAEHDARLTNDARRLIPRASAGRRRRSEPAGRHIPVRSRPD